MSEPEDPESGGRDIAVIGMSGRFPKASDLDGFWRNLAGGVEAITFLSDEELAAAGVPREHLEDPRYVKAVSLLDGVEGFDAPFFGYSAREAEIMDPQQRLFLEHAWQALENAGYVPERYEGLIGVYAGVAWNTYLLSNLTSNRDLFDGGGGFQVFITNDKDFMPTRVSYKLNLKGPSIVVQTSCSTSLVAVHLACLSLLNYECDMALAGGVTVRVPQKEGYFHHEGGLASPDGHCRSFDAKAAGTIFGSGVGLVVLKRLSEALDDGDPIRAVIKGSAINNDGSVKVSYTAPSVEGQAGVIAAAHAMAGVDVESIRYVEAHGTATSLGDPIEVTALTKVFRESTDKRGFCALGSVKSNVGHLDAAAGIAGFLKTVLALEHGQIPPSLHFEQPNPVIDFDNSPFFVNAELRDWPSDGSPRRAGVSSFGVGGTNAHVILEQAPAPVPSGPSRPWQLLRLSARSDTALAAATDNLRAWLEEKLEENEDAPLADVAYTLAVGRSVFRHRRVLVCRDGEAVDLLAGSDPSRLLGEADAEDPRDRPVVFLFPGQGAQHPGMARELYETEPVFRQEVDRCAELLRPRLGLDLRRVIWSDDQAESARQLTRTALTQPALFVVEYALARLWMSWGVRPQAMLGHSIGEYVAACLAGVFDLEGALALVAARGRLMQELPAGAMLSVPLPEEELAPLLGPHLAIGVLNEPSRSVASGPAGAIDELERTLAARGVESRRLHTSHAFHSPMMEPAVQPFAAEVRKVRLHPPEIPFLSNVTGTWITAEEATDPLYWARHLRQTVRFADGVAELLRDPRRILLEVGPGRTLATQASRHPDRAGQPVLSSLRHPQDETSDLRLLLEALGRLWLAGLAFDPAALYGNEDRRRLPLPSYPFERHRYWIDPKQLVPAAEHGAARPAMPRRRPDLADWFYLPAWKPALPPAAVASTWESRWLVLAHPAGPSARLADRLRAHGEVVTVAPGEDPGRRFAELRTEGRTPTAVVHAWGLGSDLPVAEGQAGFEAAQEHLFYPLLSLARALGADAEPIDLTLVADGLVSLTANEPSRPEKSTLLGLLRVLPQELPHVVCRALDAVSAPHQESDLLDRLVAELRSRPADELIVLRGRERWLPVFEPARLGMPDVSPFREGGVYLLTGGLEGNGYALARHLAREAKARLVLLDLQPDREGGSGPAHPAQATGSGGRWEAGAHTKEPSRGEPAHSGRAATLESLGASVLLLTADPADEDDLRRALADAEAHFGPLHGVIHAASTQGERTFRTLAELGPDECAWHFRPKAHALYALDRALNERHLDFRAVVSSLAVVLGGVGYGAYAAANTFLDAFVRERNRQTAGGSPWLAIDWDVWQFEDEAEQILAVREDLADLAMSPREGEEAFRRAVALTGAADRLLVSTGDLAARLALRHERIEELRGRQARIQSQGSAAAAPGPLHPRPLQTPYVPPEGDLEQRIVEVWQRTLGFEQIGVHDNFFELGGDSFLAIQVVSRLKEELQVDLPVARLYQGLTVRSLAALLAEDQAAATEQRAAQLEERRESMSRRKQFLEQRRAGRKTEVS